MARGELLRKLFLTHRRGNDEEFRAAAMEVISEEEKKNNHRLAKDLLRILENNGFAIPSKPLTTGNGNSLPIDKERQTLLVDVRNPERRINDIILSNSSIATIQRIMQEYRKSELLKVHAMRPSTKLLFCGPPGCGKTLCSEIIASELGLPILYTRFDAIVSSYLGETSANLRKVFDYAASGKWVVLFDEFDAIGKSRDDVTEHGELKRVINSFLQLLDSFTASSILIAATNHEQLLDSALWRRFDEIIYFPKPSQSEIQALLTIKLKNIPHHNLDIKSIMPKFKGLSHADVERVCFDTIKLAILENKDSVEQEIFDRAMKQHQLRICVAKKAANRGES